MLKVTLASRIKERSYSASVGQMTSIGTLALSLYQNEYGHRPGKQFEPGLAHLKVYNLLDCCDLNCALASLELDRVKG